MKKLKITVTLLEMSNTFIHKILIVGLAIHICLSTLTRESLGAKPSCKVCKDFVESFNKRLKDTANSNFAGGDTHWEEEKLGSYADSEVRLVEILDSVCSGYDCHRLLEESEEQIERWWFKLKHKEESSDLQKWLCFTQLDAVVPSTSTGSVGLHPAAVAAIPEVTSSSEFPFYTVSVLPSGVLSSIGGVVSAHSVKLLDKINNPEDPETRDAWWHEVRNEVRLHCRAMNCNAVEGYSETTSICDNLCVLSAYGTAVCIASPQQPLTRRLATSPGSSGEIQATIGSEGEGVSKDIEGLSNRCSQDVQTEKHPHCEVCHVPYSINRLPFEGKLTKCRICKSGLVPALLLSTCELPPSLRVRGKGTLIQTRAILSKKKWKGDENAQQVGQILPFLESKLHGRLLNKIRANGMNALFQFRMLLNVGDTMVVGTAMGTAVYLEALPGPSNLVIPSKDSTGVPGKLEKYQATLTRSQEQNKKRYELECPEELHPQRPDSADLDSTLQNDPQTGTSNGEGGMSVTAQASEIDLSFGKKEALVFPFDDQLIKEDSLYDVIADRPLPIGFYVSNTRLVPGLPVSVNSEQTKMVTTVRRSILDTRQSQNIEKQFTEVFNQLLQSLVFMVRQMNPCTLTNITYDIDLPEDNELQVAVTAMVTGLKVCEEDNSHIIRKSQSDDMIFNMEENRPHQVTPLGLGQYVAADDERKTSNRVHISSLPFISGYCVQRYLGIINLFLIRESTSVNEVGGVDSFMHLFLLEALSIARAHVAALSGNALLSYRLNELVLIEHPQKNQAQCLLNLSGDAACLSSSTVPTVDPSGLSNKDSPQHQALQAMQLLPMPELFHLAAKQSGANVNPLEPRTGVVNNQTNSKTSSDIKDSLQSKYKVTEL